MGVSKHGIAFRRQIGILRPRVNTVFEVGPFVQGSVKVGATRRVAFKEPQFL